MNRLKFCFLIFFEVRFKNIASTGVYYGLTGWQQISPIERFGVHRQVLKPENHLGFFFLSPGDWRKQVLCKL